MTDPALWIRALTTEFSRPVIARMIARQFKPMENERFRYTKELIQSEGVK